MHDSISRRRFLGLAGLTAATGALGLSGCGQQTSSDSTKKKMTFVLDYTPNTNHTGIYVAKNKGYFDEAGLEVDIIQPPEDGATQLVATGGAQFGIDFQDYLADAFGIKKPLSVVAVAAILQHNTSGLISLKKTGIDSPGKLAGHSFATWQLPVEDGIIKQLVENDGGDFDKVELIPASTTSADVIAALNSDIDAQWVYYGWDGIKLELSKYETNYLPLVDYEKTFDYYSPVIIANDQYLASDPDGSRALLAAIRKGYEYAIDHPSEAADILCKEVPELDSELVHSSQEWLSPKYRADASQWGLIDQTRWDAFYSWLWDKKLIDYEIPAHQGFSMDYLQGTK